MTLGWTLGCVFCEKKDVVHCIGNSLCSAKSASSGGGRHPALHFNQKKHLEKSEEENEKTKTSTTF